MADLSNSLVQLLSFSGHRAEEADVARAVVFGKREDVRAVGLDEWMHLGNRYIFSAAAVDPSGP